jgi:hypothetical protein
MTERKYHIIILISILLLGIIVQIISINWGLPNTNHQDSYNGDEDTNLSIFRNFDPGKLNFDPKMYVSGSLGYYLLAGSVSVGNILGYYNLVSDPDYYRENIQELRNIYIAQRLFIMLVSVLLIYLSYYIGRGIWDNNLGLLMAGYVALLPTILVNSQYCTHNMILVLFSALSFLFLVRYVNGSKNKNLFFLALFCGLSISTKHSGIFTFIFLFYALYYVIFKEKKENWVKLAFMAISIAIIAFVLTSPYFVKFRVLQILRPDLINSEDVLTGFFWNFNIKHLLTYSFDILKVYIAQIGLVSIFIFYLLFKRKNLDCFVVPLIIYVVMFHIAVLFTNYGTDSRLLPNGYFIGLLAMLGFYSFLNSLSISRVFKYIVVFIIVTSCVGYAGVVKYRFLRPDTRQISSQWIEKNILSKNSNVSIGLHESPGYATPDIIFMEMRYRKHPDSSYYKNKYNETFVIPDARVKEIFGIFGDEECKLVLPDVGLMSESEKMKWLESKSPDYVILFHETKGWPEYFDKSASYKLIKHFPAYNVLGVSKLTLYIVPVYVYEHSDRLKS